MTHPTGDRLVDGGGATQRTENLSREELQRYSRHLVLPEVGPEGQRRLKAARVLCLGVGGLGSPAALYLAAAGIGTIGLVDFDAVDATNLQRQILHDTPSIGRPKLESGAARLRTLNPHVRVERHDTRLTADNALALVSGYDVVVDGTDNFAARYLVNDACVLSGVPNAYGSIFRFEGQASVFAAPGGPCYRCLHPEPPPPGLIPSCADAGVLGVLPGVIGTIQATEALKLILGIGELLVGRFLVYDALRLRFRELSLRRDPECPVCGDHPTIHAPVEYREYCEPAVPQPEAARADVPFEISPVDLKARLEAGERISVLDVREPYELSICRIRGATSIPLGELPHRLNELPRDADLVVVCHVGPRSASAVTFLRGQGFPRARNLRGGILAWIDEVEPGQLKY